MQGLQDTSFEYMIIRLIFLMLQVPRLQFILIVSQTLITPLVDDHSTPQVHA